MLRGATAAWAILLWGVTAGSASDNPHTCAKAQRVWPAPDAVLREASEIVLKQEEHERYWCERVLLHIGDLQIRAGDFDGALRSIQASSYDYGRNSGLVRLAEELARHGQRQRAFDILRRLGADHGRGQESFEDDVQLRWIEYLIASGDVGLARKAVGLLKSDQYRPEGLRQLAVAYAKSGDKAQAAEEFKLALGAAADLKDEFFRVRAFWQTAEAQLSVGNADAAKETIRRLAEAAEWKDPWAKVSALRECAVLAARADDEETASRLFRRAIEAHEAVGGTNKPNALRLIAVAQAGAGHVDDALKTAWMIKHSAEDFARDAPREEALVAIAAAQLKANDADGALRTALSVRYFLQYRDDAIQKIVEYQVGRRNLKGALMAADKAHNPSSKATAILKAATGYARSGDRRTAEDVAAGIELTELDRLPGSAEGERFNYRLPPSWGITYDSRLAFTMVSHHLAVRRAAEVAGAAMTLSQALGHRPLQSYAVLFDEILEEEVILALARAHATSGDPGDALAWAQKIGSGGKVSSSADRDARFAVERRVYALIGVAEGVLDRANEAAPQSPP